MHMRLMNEEDNFMEDDDVETENGEGKLKSRLNKSTRVGTRGSVVVSTPKVCPIFTRILLACTDFYHLIVSCVCGQGFSAEDAEVGYEPYLWFFAAAGRFAFAG